jgi:hypothetical protein
MWLEDEDDCHHRHIGSGVVDRPMAGNRGTVLCILLGGRVGAAAVGRWRMIINMILTGIVAAILVVNDAGFVNFMMGMAVWFLMLDSFEMERKIKKLCDEVKQLKDAVTPEKYP